MGNFSLPMKKVVNMSLQHTSRREVIWQNHQVFEVSHFVVFQDTLLYGVWSLMFFFRTHFCMANTTAWCSKSLSHLLFSEHMLMQQIQLPRVCEVSHVVFRRHFCLANISAWCLNSLTLSLTLFSEHIFVWQTQMPGVCSLMLLFSGHIYVRQTLLPGVWQAQPCCHHLCVVQSKIPRQGRWTH